MLFSSTHVHLFTNTLGYVHTHATCEMRRPMCDVRRVTATKSVYTHATLKTLKSQANRHGTGTGIQTDKQLIQIRLM